MGEGLEFELIVQFSLYMLSKCTSLTVCPLFIKKDLNKDYHLLIEEFGKITGIPYLLNTLINLHGKLMNYCLENIVRTLALSSLNFLLILENQLLYKRYSYKLLDEIFTDEN